MRPTKRRQLKTGMSLAQLEKSAHQILEIKILETPKTGLLAPKKLGQDLLVSALTNLPAASPTL
jgi:hypothetical protein